MPISDLPISDSEKNSVILQKFNNALNTKYLSDLMQDRYKEDDKRKNEKGYISHRQRGFGYLTETVKSNIKDSRSGVDQDSNTGEAINTVKTDSSSTNNKKIFSRRPIGLIETYPRLTGYAIQVIETNLATKGKEINLESRGLFLDDTATSALNEFNHLQKLNLSRNHPFPIIKIDQLDNLRELNLSFNELEKVHIQNADKIQTIDLSNIIYVKAPTTKQTNNKQSDHLTVNIFGCKNLEELNISDCDEVKLNINGDRSNLKTINISNSIIADSDLESLINNTKKGQELKIIVGANEVDHYKKLLGQYTNDEQRAEENQHATITIEKERLTEEEQEIRKETEEQREAKQNSERKAHKGWCQTLCDTLLGRPASESRGAKASSLSNNNQGIELI